MYISTNLTVMSGVAAVRDQLEFTFGIKPESVPYDDGYGVRINTTGKLITDAINSACTTAVNNLGIQGLSVTNVTVNETKRTVEVNLSYSNTEITQVVSLS